MANEFFVRCNEKTNYIVRRSQFAHFLSESLVNYLGYTMEEFSKIFMKKGYPVTFNDIAGKETILNMYRRDVYTNGRLQKHKKRINISKKIPVTFTFKNGR